MSINEEINLVVKRIVDNYKPEKIIVFGSMVRGEMNSNSDLDLLIIKESSEKRPFRVKRIFELLRDVKRSLPLDIIVYSPGEIKKRIIMGDYFIKRILKEGKVLHG